MQTVNSLTRWLRRWLHVDVAERPVGVRRARPDAVADVRRLREEIRRVKRGIERRRHQRGLNEIKRQAALGVPERQLLAMCRKLYRTWLRRDRGD